MLVVIKSFLKTGDGKTQAVSPRFMSHFEGGRWEVQTKVITPSVCHLIVKVIS